MTSSWFKNGGHFVCLDSLRPSYVCNLTSIGSAWSAPSHYLNQCCNIVNWNLGNKRQWNLNRNLYIFIHKSAFEIVIRKLVPFYHGLNVLIYQEPYLTESMTQMMCNKCFCDSIHLVIFTKTAFLQIFPFPYKYEIFSYLLNFIGWIFFHKNMITQGLANTGKSK